MTRRIASRLMNGEKMESADPVGQVVAANLRRLRQRRRWTLKETAEQIADVLGSDPLSDAGLSRWESSNPPRRFAMTELFAICRVFDVRLAALFLPDLDDQIPTINSEPFFAVWNACFDTTEKMATRWQQMKFTQTSQLQASETGFTTEEIAEAVAYLRHSRDDR